jgi:hypothetical protein
MSFKDVILKEDKDLIVNEIYSMYRKVGREEIEGAVDKIIEDVRRKWDGEGSDPFRKNNGIAMAIVRDGVGVSTRYGIFKPEDMKVLNINIRGREVYIINLSGISKCIEFRLECDGKGRVKLVWQRRLVFNELVDGKEVEKEHLAYVFSRIEQITGTELGEDFREYCKSDKREDNEIKELDDEIMNGIKRIELLKTSELGRVVGEAKSKSNMQELRHVNNEWKVASYCGIDFNEKAEKTIILSRTDQKLYTLDFDPETKSEITVSIGVKKVCGIRWYYSIEKAGGFVDINNFKAILVKERKKVKARKYIDLELWQNKYD